MKHTLVRHAMVNTLTNKKKSRFLFEMNVAGEKYNFLE